MTRDAEGVLVVELHSNGGPLTFTAQDHTEFVDAFYRFCQDRAHKIVTLTGPGGQSRSGEGAYRGPPCDWWWIHRARTFAGDASVRQQGVGDRSQWEVAASRRRRCFGGSSQPLRGRRYRTRSAYSDQNNIRKIR